MEKFFAIYKHENIEVGGMISYTYQITIVIESGFVSSATAEERIKALPAGEYLVMPYFKK